MSTGREFTTTELANTVVESWEGAPPSILKVVLSLVQLLQHGKPVPPEELASATELEVGVAIKLAKRLGAEFDDEGNLVGWGLTLIPTPHKYRVNGHDLYAWCAADTISFPSILNHTAVIESPDPISGENVRLTVTPDGIEGLNPSSAVVSWSLEPDLDNIRGSFCNLTHYFVSRESAAEYVSKHPGLVIVPVEGVFEAAKILRDTEAVKSLLEHCRKTNPKTLHVPLQDP